MRKEILEGNFSTVDELHTRFLANPRNQLPPPVVREVIEEAGSSDDESDSDEEMSEAPEAVSEEPRQRLEPTIDEDGFELVQKRGNRKR